MTINFTLFDGNEVRVNAVPYVAGVAAVVPVSIVLGGYMTDDAPLFLNDVLKITSPNIPVYVVKEYLEENGRTTTTP
ncbi:MAG: hypothetical protein K0U78_15900 [Actinomycetia bacterium]|nr:hypothetical protein [Actinomycetes bacterium]